MSDYRKKFIALDLETTHLDMREGRIMEVGAVEAELLFDEKKSAVAVKFGKSFSTLVNPEIPASPIALTLTGITAEGLSMAPTWREVKPKLEKFLGGEVILGHNIWFDLLYLKNQGLNLKNGYLDTLEITQTVLPLLVSHSLEYLAQEFGVLDDASHRALADAQSAARVLGAALNEYLSYSADLQREIKTFFAKSHLNFGHLFVDLPEMKRRKKGRPKKSPAIGKARAPEDLDKLPSEFPDKTLISVPLGFSRQQDWLSRLAQEGQSRIVAVSHPMYLDLLPENQKIPGPSQALCDKRWEWLKHQQEISDDALKIFVKIAIFREIKPSWNLGEVKWTVAERSLLPSFLVDPEICPKHECGFVKSLKLGKNQVYFTDIESLFSLVHDWPVDFDGFPVILFDLGKIEDEFSEHLTATRNLRQIRERLKILYPLEKLNISRYPRVNAEAEAIANELDLFFGVLHLVYLKKESEFAEIIMLGEEETESERFQKLLHPAEKLVRKLEIFQVYLQNQALVAGEDKLELLALGAETKKMAAFLKELFWEHDAQKNYWFKFNSQWVDLNIAPRDLAVSWKAFRERFKTLTIIDAELPSLSWQYFQNRLGITDFAKQVSNFPSPPLVEVHLFPKPQNLPAISALVQQLPGKTIIVVPNESQLVQMHELLHGSQPNTLISTYKLSGNLQAVKNRFRQAKRAVLLVTTNAFMRSLLSVPPAKNLVVVRLPFEAPGRTPSPSGQSFANTFVTEILPRAVHLLHTMLTRFLGAAQPEAQVYLLDPRVLTEYDRAFLKYLEEFPNFDISTAGSGK